MKHRLTLVAGLFVALVGLANLIDPRTLLQPGPRVSGAMLTNDEVTGSIADKDRPVVRVSGFGEVSVEPDLVLADIGVETEGTDAADAVADNSASMDDVLGALADAGLDDGDLGPPAFSIRLQRPPVEAAAEEPAEPVYVVVNQVTARIADVESIGEVLQAVVDAGANRVGEVRFTVSDSSPHRARAIERAVRAARSDAEALADALGVALGPLVEAVTIDAGGRPLVEPSLAFEEAAREGVPIRPGPVVVTAEVQLTFEVMSEAQAREPAAVGEPTDTPEAEVADTRRPATTERPARATPTLRPRQQPTSEATATVQPASATPAGEGADLNFRVLGRGENARYIAATARAVLASDADALASQLAPLLPEDVTARARFDREVLIGVFVGRRSGSGYRIDIRDVSLQDGRIVLQVTVDASSRRGTAGNAYSSPYELIAVARESLPAELDVASVDLRLTE